MGGGKKEDIPQHCITPEGDRTRTRCVKTGRTGESDTGFSSVKAYTI